jgi:hypothetical protein
MWHLVRLLLANEARMRTRNKRRKKKVDAAEDPCFMITVTTTVSPTRVAHVERNIVVHATCLAHCKNVVIVNILVPTRSAIAV